jgi:hypothetical protein
VKEAENRKLTSRKLKTQKKNKFNKMANLINEAEIRETWSPIIESATGIQDTSKLAWMSEYCHNHKLYEDAAIMTLNPGMNLGGMGATAFPGQSALTTGPGTGALGSGDKAPTLLPLAMQVAAQTIGLDLVPVVPMAGPMGLLSYLDFVYEGGSIGKTGGADGKNAPTYVKGGDGANGSIQGTTVTESTATVAGDITEVGTSRIDGDKIWKIEESGQDLIDAAGNGISKASDLFANGEAQLVAALDDHIRGFSAGDEDGNPYSREGGESTPDKIMGLSLFSKSVSAETYQVAAAVTREQVQDLKQFGVDAVAQVESVLTNEITQNINDLIIESIAKLGALNIQKAGFTAGEFDVDATYSNTSGNTLSGGQTEGSQHRKVLTGILAAANLIANRGRRGAGNFAVVGPKVATAIQSVSGFVPNPFANTATQAAGAIYPVGTVAGVQVYTNPKWEWTKETVLVGRKGDGNGPGLVFMPYLMAESVQTIAEGTMAPKVAVKSRFALVAAGFHPETQYAKFAVTVAGSNAAAGSQDLINIA